MSGQPPVPRDDTDRDRLRQAWTDGWGAGAAAMSRRDGKPSKRNPYTHHTEETT